MPSASTTRLPHRLALATAGVAVLLLLFGGTVTGIGAGMAVDGWWIVDRGKGDHFLLLYPLPEWLHSTGKFYEHGHRLIGALVGLLAIATLVVAWRKDGRRAAVVAGAVALLAIVVQGTIGGFRVLENSPRLAFLHGAFGQLTFAIVVAAAAVLSPRYVAAEPRPCKLARPARRRAVLAFALVLATIVMGAMLRHGMRHGGAFRPLLSGGASAAVHVVLALAAAGAVIALIRTLRATAEQGARGGHDRAPLARLAARLVWLLALQLLLGVASLAVVFWVAGPRAQHVHDSLVPTLHVLVGALLLSQTLAAVIWTRRLVTTGAATEAASDPRAAAAGGHA